MMTQQIQSQQLQRIIIPDTVSYNIESPLPSSSIIVTSADAVDIMASEELRSTRNTLLFSVMESSKIGIVIADRVLPAANTSNPDPMFTSTPSI